MTAQPVKPQRPPRGTVIAHAGGHCRECGKKIVKGATIRIIGSKWYHHDCVAQRRGQAVPVLKLTAAGTRERMALHIDNADRQARLAKSTSRERRLARIDAYQAAIAAETRRNIAFYGLDNGPD